MWSFASRRREPAQRVEPHFRNASPENPTTSLANPASWLTEAFGGGASFAGPHVSETTAMRSTAVFRCVALKSGLIGSLPLMVFRRTDTGRVPAPEHPLYARLHDSPNDLMSAFVWKELIGANLMLAGNHYSVIEYDQAARVVGILPIQPRQVTVTRPRGARRNRYVIDLGDGREVLDQGEVLHVPGIGFDGLKGISPIAWAGRQPIGISLAMEEAVGRLHTNSMRPGGWMAVPAGISPDGVKRLRAELEAMYAGVGNTGRTLLVDHGSQWNPMQMTMEDAETLESRRFQVADIARLFGMPPHMIGETDKTSSWGTGVEQQTIGFQKFNLDPDLCRIEGELNRKLFEHPYYCEFNREALNAMDAKTQSELYASAVMNAGMTPNEVRRRRNLPDQPGGDELYIQSATVPLRLAGQVQPPAPAKK